MSDPYDVLVGMIQKACKDQQYYDLAGLGPEDGESPIESLEKDLLWALNEVRSIRGHSHIWNEDSRCTICGADGLA